MIGIENLLIHSYQSHGQSNSSYNGRSTIADGKKMPVPLISFLEDDHQSHEEKITFQSYKYRHPK